MIVGFGSSFVQAVMAIKAIIAKNNIFVLISLLLFNWLIDCFLGALQGGVVAAVALKRIGDIIERPPNHERYASQVIIDIDAVKHIPVLRLDAGAHAAVKHIIEVGTQQ